MKIKEGEIREALIRIKDDELFRNAPRYAELLEYLVEKAIRGEQLKEVTIGLELFNKQYDEKERSTGSVRVYMFNLRKRLTEYYQSRGADEAIRFELSKGSYNIIFVRSVDRPTARLRRRWFVGGAVAVVAVVLSVVFGGGGEATYCWSNIFGSERAVTLVLADHLTVRGSIGGEGVAVQHPKITTHSEYLHYIKERHCDTLQLNSFPLYTKAIPHAVKELSRWFVQHDREFNIISESELKFNETKRSNIVYVGQSKLMNISRDIFLKGSDVFDVEVDIIRVTRGGKVSEYKSQYRDGKLAAEYAFVSYIPLQGGNEALYFVSNNDVGAMATVRLFTDRDRLGEFYAALPEGVRYFNALFRVSGVERNDVGCELVELEIVE
ncbi:MAG: hypothetical protein SNG14_04025 [Rikenellaceae bacterium]